MTANIAEMFPGATCQQVDFNAPAGFWPANCNAAVGDGRLAGIVTCRNLCISDALQPVWGEPGVIRTRSYFAYLDDNLVPLQDWQEFSQPEIDVIYPGVRGAEDPRLFWRDGEWLWAGTIREHHASGDPRVCVGAVDGGLRYIVDGAGWIKNQMPTGVMQPEFIDSVTPATPHLHGGGVVAFEDGYLGVCKGHGGAGWPNRVYLTQFARFASDGQMLELTEPFTMTGCPIEVTTGLTLHGGKLIVGFGRMDREGWFACVPLAAVLNALRPL